MLIQHLKLQDSNIYQRSVETIRFSLLNLIDHIKTRNDLPENGIAAIKPRSAALLIALVVLKTFLVRILALLHRPLTPCDIELRSGTLELWVLVISITSCTKRSTLMEVLRIENLGIYMLLAILSRYDRVAEWRRIIYRGVSGGLRVRIATLYHKILYDAMEES